MHEIERNRSQKLGCQANGGARAGRAPPRSANGVTGIVTIMKTTNLTNVSKSLIFVMVHLLVMMELMRIIVTNR